MANSVQDHQRGGPDMTRAELRCADVQVTSKNTQNAYDIPLAAMREPEAEPEGHNEERLSVKSRFLAAGDAYRRDLAAHLPDDILWDIFEKALAVREIGDVTDMRPGSFGSCTRALGESALPFASACVCRRWREAALALSALWSSITITSTKSDDLERLALLLRRSKSAPLDIIFYPSPDGANPDVARAMLDALEEHAWRWEVSQQVHCGPVYRVLMDDLPVVRRPAPQLRRLYIHVYDDAAEGGALDPDLRYLQISPHIEQLVLISPWVLVPQTPFVFPRLVSLVWCQPGTHHFWDILYAARDTLKEVVFAIGASGLPQPLMVTPPFTMDSLEHLHIRGLSLSSVLQFSGLKAPRLQELFISSIAITSDLDPFFETISPTVRTLTLHGAPSPDAPVVLSKLSNVECLLFVGETKFFTLPYTVSDEFFASLAAPLDTPGDAAPTWIWPKLSKISILRHGSFEARNGDNLRQLVRVRAGPDLDCSSLPRRLISVVLEDDTSPKRLRDEIKLMLA